MDVPVYDCFVFCEPEQSWFGVSGLWLWGDTAHLHKPEARTQHAIYRHPVLVKPGRHAHWVLKHPTPYGGFLQPESRCW